MNWKRSKFFVDPSFQGRLLLRLVTYWVLYHVALWHTMFLVTLIGTSINQDPSLPAKGLWRLYREFTSEHISVIVCFLALLPIFGRDMIRFSHRMAGPLVRFRNTMQCIADGRPVRAVKLRKYDLMSEFLTTFNAMVTSWNARIGAATPKEAEETELEPAGSGH
jgi:hypothetical protein